MPEVKWIKVTTNIFDDSKILMIESMPDADAVIVIWLKLLCLAGKENNSGVFVFNDRIPYTEEMLATIFRRPINTVRLALNQFEQLGMIEIINNTITIPNWDKHQTLDKIEKQTEYMRNYMRERREKQRQLTAQNCKPNSKSNRKANVNALEEDKKKNKNNPPIVPPKGDDAFDDFWKEYPRKVGKQAALKAWKKIRPGAELRGKILEAVKNAKRSAEWTRDGGRYIPNPATWLNQGRWDDELTFSAKSSSGEWEKIVQALTEYMSSEYQAAYAFLGEGIAAKIKSHGWTWAKLGAMSEYELGQAKKVYENATP